MPLLLLLLPLLLLLLPLSELFSLLVLLDVVVLFKSSSSSQGMSSPAFTQFEGGSLPTRRRDVTRRESNSFDVGNDVGDIVIIMMFSQLDLWKYNNNASDGIQTNSNPKRHSTARKERSLLSTRRSIWASPKTPHRMANQISNPTRKVR